MKALVMVLMLSTISIGNVHNEEDDIELKLFNSDEIIEGDKECKEWTERSNIWFETVNR